MGGGRWTDDDWTSYSSTHIKSKRSTTGSAGVYSSHKMNDDFDPKNIEVRESRDSDDNPNSTGVIVGLDVTGSMSPVLDSMAREGLNKLATEIYERKPVTDPHIMYMGVGDVHYDRAPLQCTQFEADIRIAEQLTKIYLEQGGGANSSESYTLPWYFALNHTSIDCFLKRGQKGYLFTVGDECVPPNPTPEQIRKVFGYKPQSVLTNEALLKAVQEKYYVYHIIIEQGHNYGMMGKKVDKSWRELMGQNVLNLSDSSKMSEVIVSTIQFNEGATADEIIKSWDGSTAVVVGKALENTAVSVSNHADPSSGIISFD